MLAQLFLPFTSRKDFIRMLVLIAIYLVFSLPFSAMEFIPTFTNLRPVTTLIPIYGIFFGPTGSWAYAIGNLLYDFFSGTLVISSIGGFVGNFFATWLFWALSRRFIREGRLLGALRSLFAYALVSVAASLAVAGAVMFWIVLFIAGVDAGAVGLTIFGNDLFFFLVPGIGIAILMATEFGRKPAILEGRGDGSAYAPDGDGDGALAP